MKPGGQKELPFGFWVIKKEGRKERQRTRWVDDINGLLKHKLRVYRRIVTDRRVGVTTRDLCPTIGLKLPRQTQRQRTAC